MHNEIITNGIDFAGTKALFNIGFTIENPTDKVITNKERNWNEAYAAAEWQWYLSGDPNIIKLGQLYGKIPPIWERMADENGEVNSNYGYQWKRNNQLENVINMLKQNNETRQAAISIYDGKTIHQYAHDTPCTYAVQFTIVQSKLYMSVYMRSNDLWYGFCNDQYQFASLQEMVAERLNLPVGTYYHHAHNLHLYNDKI
jgi:thymidylate synthase